jgi:hypothetical protein
MMLRFIVAAALLAVATLGGAQTNPFRDLIVRIDRPKEGDSEKLAAYGDEAFKVLLPIVRRRIVESNERGRHEPERQRVLNALMPLLGSATPARTADVTALYELTNFDVAQMHLLGWMAKKGTPELNRELFEDILELNRKSDSYQGADLPVIGLVRIGDARSVKLLLQILKDDKLSLALKREVYIRIAATGNVAALDAVRQGIRRSRVLPPLEQRIDLPSMVESGEATILGTATRKEVVWGLVKCGLLGNRDDLWIWRKEGAKWVAPMFTGVSAYWPHHQTGSPYEGNEKHEAAIKQLTQSTDWVQSFVGNGDIPLDSDQDGYTDIIELWLGLDPQKKDADGDGIPDGIDKNPKAAARKLNETEATLKGAFEAATAFRPFHGNLFATFPPSIPPIELDSWSHLVLPHIPVSADPSRAVFGFGFTIGYQSGPPVRFSKDGKTAEVEIRESGGYYESTSVITLRKFGQEWFPVDERNTHFGIS